MPKPRPDREGAHRQLFTKNRAIIYRTEDICWICGEPVDKTLKSPHPMSKTVDHRIPVSRGGHPSSLENLALAHRKCNRAKSNKLFFEMEKTEKPKKNKFDVTRDWREY